MPPYENITPESGGVTDVTIGGVAQQMDDTDKAAVSLHAEVSAPGDTALRLNDGTDQSLRVNMFIGGRFVDIATSAGDAVAATEGAAASRAWSYMLNGSTWDRQRNNTEITLLASAARTATVASSDQTNFNAKGVIIVFDVTVDAAAASLTMDIEFKDPVSSVYESLLLTSAAITAVGTHTYIVYPGVGAASGDVVQVAGFPLGRTWRINVTAADADSITYSVGASYIL